MKQRLLATKLHIPGQHDTMVLRPRLVEQLNNGLREKRKLTLISAPAGYGKTTLASAWVHSLNEAFPKVAWLSLDQADNDPTRFFSYWLAACQSVDPAIGQRITPWLDTPHPQLHAALDELLNDLATLDVPALFFFEDYHVIHQPLIHEALEYFLDHQPAQVHLALITRQDPPLPLPRLRARRQLTEIRAHDLRFTPQETRQFFAHAMKLDLAEESAAALEERTEGWAVGLQLAGLAIQKLNDPRPFIETFRGSHRYILDYLAEEVIRQQREDLRAFLVQTSIVERFNASLCAALTGRAAAQASIASLEEANLFVVPLDDERTWYRYHHLFSDYLQSLLSGPEQAALYQKASAWHEANQLIEDAVRYALASGDREFAADVIQRALTRDAIWSSGNLTLLSSWLDGLPAQALQRRPRLGLNAARILYLAGQHDLAEKYIAQTERSLKSMPDAPEVEEMLALASLYRGSIAAVRGDFQRTVELIRYAQEHIPCENHLAHARALFDLGLAYEGADQTGRAVQYYLQSSEAAQTAGVHFLAISARCSAAQVLIRQARLSLAEQACQKAIQLTEGRRIPPLGLAWIVLGGIALERNDLPRAEQLLLDGLALSRQGGLTDNIVAGLSHLTRLRAMQGNLNAALAANQEAHDLLQTFGAPQIGNLSRASLARLQLYCGQKQAAMLWATEYRQARPASSGEFEDLTLARLLLAKGELDEEIPAILHPLMERAEAAGRMQTCIEVMLLLGLYHQARHDPQQATAWLEKSLRLAAPEGYARIFLDEGQPLLALLPKVRDAAPELVDALLKMGQAARAPIEQLADPLSEQELRVLRLIVEGKSNREIAEKLVISVGTAKWHVHNILQKLGVNNRPQAIAAARELGI